MDGIKPTAKRQVRAPRRSTRLGKQFDDRWRVLAPCRHVNRIRKQQRLQAGIPIAPKKGAGTDFWLAPGDLRMPLRIYAVNPSPRRYSATSLWPRSCAKFKAF